MRIEGLQEILNKLTRDYRKKESVFDFLRQRRNVDDVKEDMKRYDEKLGIKEREDEKLKIFTQLRIFDKITYLNYTTIDTNIDWYDLVFNGAIFRAAKFEEELKKGKKMKFFRVSWNRFLIRFVREEGSLIPNVRGPADLRSRTWPHLDSLLIKNGTLLRI